MECLRLKTGSLSYFAVCVILLLCAPAAYGWPLENRGLDFHPGATLLYPTTDNIDLTGKEYLEFKWERFHLVQTDYFDFRLYKGYQTTASNLILKQRFSPAEYPIKVAASMFEQGQVYSWVLVQVFNSGQKSDRSFSSFKIIKK